MALPKASRWTPAGHVSEGSGMNIFLVLDGALITPPVAASILPGINARFHNQARGDFETFR